MRKEDDTEVEFSKLHLDPTTITEKEIRELVSRLLGPKGITIKNRKVKLKTYKNCFFGKDLVTWLCDNKIAEDRKKAELIGQKFIEFNYMKQAVEENGPLKDDTNVPYRFHNVSMDQDKTRRGRSVSHGPDNSSIIQNTQDKLNTHDLTNTKLGSSGTNLRISHAFSLSPHRPDSPSPQRREETGNESDGVAGYNNEDGKKEED